MIPSDTIRVDGLVRVVSVCYIFVFFFSSRRRHTRFDCDWSSDVCSSDLFLLESASRVFNEIQPGSYVFMDADYNRNVWEEAWPCFEQSLFVLATVMSAPSPGRAVLDAGLKASSVDSGMPQVHERPVVEDMKPPD